MSGLRSSQGLRWSSVRECPRKAAYEALGAPARDRTRDEEGWLWRGKQLGRDFAIILAAQARQQGKPYRIFVASGVKGEWPIRWRTWDRGKAAFIVEEPVRWPLGVMHPDIRVVESDTLIEVLSSAHASDEMVGSKMLQLVGQIEHAGAKGGAVVVVNPAQPLDYEIFPIAKTSTTYAELAEEMRARIASVQAWADGGELPERVCAKPSEARGHFCLHGETCFEGWEQPDPDVVLSSDHAIAVGGDLYRRKQAERAAKEMYDLAVTDRKKEEQRLADILDTAGIDGAAKSIRVGSVEVDRIVVSDRESFALKKARTAGAWTDAHDQLFAPFVSVGGGHVRYQVDRVGEQPLEAPVEDFGPVPFLGDERDAA